MAKDKMYGKTLRKNFARHEEIMEMPNLLELQKKSYRWFLDEGLQEVFTDVASITNYAGNLELSFIGYKMDEAPKYDVEECKARDATYAAPLKVNVRLYNNQTQEIKEQEIFMGDFPLMTQSGTFVINGAERVVVSQIVRSPGVYYGKEIDLKTDLPLLTSTVIPYRGAWLEYETDTNEVFWVRIDKNRKIPITELIRAIGGQAEQYADLKTDTGILDLFGDDDRIKVSLEKDACKTYEEAMLEIYRKLRPGEPPTVEASEGLIKNLFFDPRRYDLSMVGRYKFNKKLSLWTRIHGQKLAYPVADPRTGEILFDAGHVMTSDEARELDAIGVNDVVTATAKTPGSGFSLELSGEHLGDLASSGSDMRRNHAVLALFAIARAAGREPDVALHVDKHIPVGAGLGGGSADAAATLLAVNTLWGLHWPIERLRDIAATLGADMPFCLEGGYAHGTGFGERIIPLEDDSSCVQTLRDRGFAGQLLVGAYHAQLSTPNVYSTFDKMGAGDGDDNHLQRAAVALHPRSGEAIEAALAAGASRSFVSGSGPSVIAFVPDDAVARRVRTAWEQSATVDRIIAAQAPARPVITVLPSLSYRVRQ